MVVEGTKTDAVLPHCRECTTECIGGWSTSGSTPQLDLQQNYEMPNRKKTEVIDASSRGFVRRIGFLISFWWAMQHR